MSYKLNKVDIVEIVRLWDVPKILEALDNGIPAENLVYGHRTDVLLQSILLCSEPLFLKIMSKPYNFKKNKFQYAATAISVASVHKETIYIRELLKQMDEVDLQVKSPLSYNNLLHKAAQEGLQTISLVLAKKGLKWDSINKEKQTPLHMLLRKVSYLNLELIEDIKNINIDKKDKMQISCRDILISFSYDKEWLAHKNNQLLLDTFQIPYHI